MHPLGDRLMASVRKQTLSYLASHNVVTLATQGPEGPWAAAVFYVSDGFTLYFISAPSTRHAKNLAANPAVAAAIHEDYDDWRAIKGIQLEGQVELLSGERRDRAIGAYSAKFPLVGPAAPGEIAQALERMDWYRIVPSRAYFIDNTRGLGHRDEVDLTGLSPSD